MPFVEDRRFQKRRRQQWFFRLHLIARVYRCTAIQRAQYVNLAGSKDQRNQYGATPLIVEENPARYVNSCCVDPGHANVDETGTWHEGGGNYIAFDGHSVRLKPEGPNGPTTHAWRTKTPSGAIVSLTSHGSGGGGWNNTNPKNSCPTSS